MWDNVYRHLQISLIGLDACSGARFRYDVFQHLTASERAAFAPHRELQLATYPILTGLRVQFSNDAMRRGILASWSAIALLLGGMRAGAQGATAPSTSAPEVSHSDLPPSTIYSETVAPFERTRSDPGNWSEIELAAFRTATTTAKTECQSLEQTPHEGEEALALARLCSVGMDWDGTYSAARWYTRKSAPVEAAPHLAMGFGLLVQADLNLYAIARAMEDLGELRDRLPLSADTDSIFTYAIDSLEIMQPEAGLEAARLRQPGLLQVIAGRGNATPPLQQGVAEEEAWHTLSLLRLAHRTQDEEHAKSELLEAIGRRTTTLSTTDLYVAKRGRKRYEWLDKPSPEFHVARNSYPAAHQKSAPADTELIVIEREDAADLSALALGVDTLRSRLPKGAHATMIVLKAPAVAAPAQPQVPAATIHALYTKDDLLETFGFSNGPLFLVRDAQQKVKYLGNGSSAWLHPQMQAERLIHSSLDQKP